jgi:hypothetical protein
MDENLHFELHENIYLYLYEFHCIRIEKSLVIYNKFTCQQFIFQFFVTHFENIIKK